MSVHKNIVVRGFVQGVSFRKQTRRIAVDLGVNGWVRNVSDGSVEAYLEGDEKAVDAVIAWCAFGPKKGKVDEVKITDYWIGSSYSDFNVLDDRQIVF